MRNDPVNHPSHYTQGGIECIDAISAAVVNLRGVESMLVGNAMKYLWRFDGKNGVEDLKKAKWYIDRLIQVRTDAAGGGSSSLDREGSVPRPACKVGPCRGYDLNEYPNYEEGTMGANLSFGGTD